MLELWHQCPISSVMVMVVACCLRSAGDLAEHGDVSLPLDCSCYQAM
jgi:hypothetical protein